MCGCFCSHVYDRSDAPIEYIVEGKAVISLDSSEWHRLRHAYGAASDIPRLLRQLADNPGPTKNRKEEPWFSLWSALCHQGDVYDASFAAVPHIVEIGIAASGPIDFGFFQLPASIEVGRSRRHEADLPPQLKNSYLGALRRLHECAFKHAEEDWDSTMAQAVAAALAAAKGQVQLAEAIGELDRDTIAQIIAGDV